MLSARSQHHSHPRSHPRSRTLTVFFADKEQLLSNSAWSIAVLAAAAKQATGVPDAKFETPCVERSVLAFDGYTDGDSLHQAAMQAVQQLLRDRQPLTLNCCGAGSGGISALRLTACLAHVPKIQLDINLLLIDPVGKTLTPSLFSVFSAGQGTTLPDVSGSRNLSRVLSLYAASRSVTVPLFPEYPAQCAVEEEVCPGAHAEIQKMDPVAGRLVYLRSLLFLQECGTSFSASISLDGKLFHANRDTQVLAADLADIYQFFVSCHEEKEVLTQRQGYGQRRVYIAAENSGNYLNTHHRLLVAGVADHGPCLYGVKTPPGWPWGLIQVLCWLLAGVGAATVLQYTGMLVMVPLLTALPAMAGGGLAAGVLSLFLPAVWLGIVKPLARLIGQYLTSSSCRLCRPAARGGTYVRHFVGAGLMREGGIDHFPDPEADPVTFQSQAEFVQGLQAGYARRENSALRPV